jgi:hypothetical protein
MFAHGIPHTQRNAAMSISQFHSHEMVVGSCQTSVSRRYLQIYNICYTSTKLLGTGTGIL